jgi:hypothetical protein
MWGMNSLLPEPFSPESAAPAQQDNVQLPLGSEPDYDLVLDIAVEYTFPCSDPIAVDTCCGNSALRKRVAMEIAPQEPARS